MVEHLALAVAVVHRVQVAEEDNFKRIKNLNSVYAIIQCADIHMKGVPPRYN